MDNFWISFCGELDEGYKPDFRINKDKPDFYEGYYYTHVYNSDFIEKLKSENDRYREALEFYANYKNWMKSLSDTHYSPEPISMDCGLRAKQALKGE